MQNFYLLESYFLLLSHKRLSFVLKNSGGRNFLGRICVFHRGGATRKRCCSLDRLRRVNSFGLVCKVFKESVRSSFSALVIYKNGLFSFISTSEFVALSSTIYSGNPPLNLSEGWNSIIFSLGSALPLSTINLFSLVNNIELFSGSGFKLARAAGVGAVFSNKVLNRCFLKLSSGWAVSVPYDSYAVLGVSSNVAHKYYSFQSAGKRRALGFRPVVRGVAKNPCDHPHGGGEGKSSPPRAPTTPWGHLTKGTPTTNKIIARVNRRKFKVI